MRVVEGLQIGALAQAPPYRPGFSTDPSMPKQVQLMEGLFGAIFRAQDRIAESLALAQEGKFDVPLAKALLYRDRDSAFYWIDKAWGANQALENQGYFSEEEGMEIHKNLVMPLFAAIRETDEAIVQAGEWPLRYWNTFKLNLVKWNNWMVPFFGEKWKKLLRGFNYLNDEIAGVQNLLAAVQPLQGRPDVARITATITKDLGVLQAYLKNLRNYVSKSGIALEKVEGAAMELAKQEAGLGAVKPLFIILPLIGAVEVGATVFILYSAMAVVLVGVMFELSRLFLNVVGLGKILARVDAEVRAEADEEIRAERLQQVQDADKAVQATQENTKTYIDGIMDTMGVSDAKRSQVWARINADMVRMGEPPVEPPHEKRKRKAYIPYVIAGGVAVAAAVTYFYIKRK